MRFFSPDSLHLNTKSFKSLHDFVARHKHEWLRHSSHNHLISLYGNYRNFPDEMSAEYDVYSQYSKHMLLEAHIDQIKLIEICYLELMAFVSTYPDFSKIGISWTKEFIFDYLYEFHHDDLVRNISAAAFWVHYWKKYLPTQKNFDAALIFSGSLTYTRALIEILKKTPTRVFILETSFTGNDYYCEERFTPIPNNSFIGRKNYSQDNALKEENYIRDRVKALNKVILASNLNVKQPLSRKDPLFASNKPALLIIGQVVNDFSLLNLDGIGVSSVAIYEELIDRILQHTDYTIIFKAHPWERHKANLKQAFTADHLSESFKDNDERFKIVEDYNIGDLFSQVNHTIVINSQAGIEAAWHGFKPITLGKPFYRDNGFTHDYHHNAIDDVIRYLNDNEKSLLTLDEYELFERFLVKLMNNLVSRHPSGIPSLNTILLPFNNIPLSKPPKYTSSNIIHSSVSHIECTPVKSKNRLEKGLYKRRWNKLRQNPRQYFADSRHPLLRYLSKL